MFWHSALAFRSVSCLNIKQRMPLLPLRMLTDAATSATIAFIYLCPDCCSAMPLCPPPPLLLPQLFPPFPLLHH